MLLYGECRVVRGVSGCTEGHFIRRVSGCAEVHFIRRVSGCAEVILYGGCRVVRGVSGCTGSVGLHGGGARLYEVTYGRVISSKYNCVGVVLDLYCDKTRLHDYSLFLRFQKKKDNSITSKVCFAQTGVI